MAKKTKMEKEVEKGEQLDLIDVAPENAGQILEAVKIYKKYQAQRLKFLEKEVEAKQEILDLVHKSGLKRLDDGRIKFKCDNFVITVEPADEKIKIKEEGGES